MRNWFAYVFGLHAFRQTAACVFGNRVRTTVDDVDVDDDDGGRQAGEATINLPLLSEHSLRGYDGYCGGMPPGHKALPK